MGEHIENLSWSAEQMRRFSRQLLGDIHALELLLKEDRLERARRVGAEQEITLVDENWRPAPRSMEFLAELPPGRFDSELASFNLELNLPPLKFEGGVLREMEGEINRAMERLSEMGRGIGAHPALFGILPTIRKRHLSLEYMTPKPRYAALNEALTRLRGEAYDLYVKGIDELMISQDSVMLEAANTSFQLHWQTDPEEFVQLYNLAQALAGPLLAVAVNSPMLGQFRLWRETRIALFQQSVDTRRHGKSDRIQQPRVHFGTQWLEDSVLELFKEDVARFKVLIADAEPEDSLSIVQKGGVPRLNALRLHNGTVYRWNRACYGVSEEGLPHLRIENRILPAGPSVPDEIANAALWFGLMSELPHLYPEISQCLNFDDAKDNFFSAAQVGLNAQFSWIDGLRPASDLLLDELLPQARAGLKRAQIDQGDIDHYLGIVQARVELQRTGAQWTLRSLNAMDPVAPVWEKIHALTASSIRQQGQAKPVHTWALARQEEGGGMGGQLCPGGGLYAH